jgi:hypothetical protein
MTNGLFSAVTTIERITPEDASLYLADLFEKQRAVNPDHVKRLAAEMTRGKWRLSNDAITLINGKLANGQHRLLALVASGRSENFHVFRTTDKALFDSIDSGISRSIPAVLRAEQFENYNLVCAIANLAIRHIREELTIKSGGGNAQIRSTFLSYVRTNREILEGVAKAVNHYASGTNYFSRTLSGSMLFIATEKGLRSEMEEFLAQLYGKASPSPHVHRLRERIFNSIGNTKTLPRMYLYGLAVKTFNHRGKKTLALRIGPSEEFPKIG